MQNNHRPEKSINPAAWSGDVLRLYRNAVEVLSCRMLAEPYNMHLIIDRIHDAMFLGEDTIPRACIRLFKKGRAYSTFSVAQDIRANVEQEAEHSVGLIGATRLAEMARRHAETTLMEAFDVFEIAYGQWVEMEIGHDVYSLIAKGLTPEEIRVHQHKERQRRGVLLKVDVADGRAEFEQLLSGALRGEVPNYPVKTPLGALRRFLPCFEPGEYVIAAGRTGMGKSYFGLNCLYSCALDGVPAAYVNLENAPKDVQRRLWQMRSGIRFEHDLSHKSDAETRRIVESWEWVKACSVRVFNTGRNLKHIAATIRRDYLERGTQLFVVDYIQLMRDEEGRRQRLDELAEISATLRALALELKVVVMGIAQVNREAEKSADKRPQLSDLRGSGDLEQDATTVILLYRPGYYDIDTDRDGSPYPENYADLHIAKGRNSGPAMVKCRFDHVRGFYDPEPEGQPGPSYNFSPMPRQEPEEEMPF